MLPHPIIGKIGDGLYRILHPEDCGCQYILSPSEARWITYDMLHGKARCNRCQAELLIPCPVAMKGFLRKIGYPDLESIRGELIDFASRHDMCKEEAPGGTIAESPEPAKHDNSLPGTV